MNVVQWCYHETVFTFEEKTSSSDVSTTRFPYWPVVCNYLLRIINEKLNKCLLEPHLQYLMWLWCNNWNNVNTTGDWNFWFKAQMRKKHCLLSKVYMFHFKSTAWCLSIRIMWMFCCIVSSQTEVIHESNNQSLVGFQKMRKI